MKEPRFPRYPTHNHDNSTHTPRFQPSTAPASIVVASGMSTTVVLTTTTTSTTASSMEHQQQRDTSSSTSSTSAFHAMKNSGKEPPKRPLKKLSRSTGPVAMPPHGQAHSSSSAAAAAAASFPLAPPGGCFMMPPLFAGPASLLGMPQPPPQALPPSNPKDIIRQPNDWDVCLGDIEHPGTRAWRDVVVHAASQDPLPPEGCSVTDILYQLRQKKGVSGRFLVKIKGSLEGFRMATPWEVDWWTQQGFWHVVQRRQELGASGSNFGGGAINLPLHDFPNEEQLIKRAMALAAATSGPPRSNNNAAASHNSPNHTSINNSNNNVASTTNNRDHPSSNGNADTKNLLSLQQVFQDATSQLQRDEWLANQSTSSHIIHKGLKAHKALYYLQPFSTVATLVWSDIFKKKYENEAPGNKSGNSLEDRLDRARRVKEIKKLEQAEQLCIQFVQGMMRVFLEEDEDENINDPMANDEPASPEQPRKRPREDSLSHGNAGSSNNGNIRPRSQPTIAVDDDSDNGSTGNKRRQVQSHDNKTTSSQSSTSTSPNVILPDRHVVIPKARDVCFAMINHPGTKAWRETVDSLSGRADLDWSINIHHLVKAQMEMEGRSFYVCLKQDQHRNKELRNAQWCLASDDEVMQKTRQRFRDFRKPPRTERVPVRGSGGGGSRGQRGSSVDENDDDDDDEEEEEDHGDEEEEDHGDEEATERSSSPASRAKSPPHLPSPPFLAATMDKVVSTVNDSNGKDPLARLASAAAFAPPAKVKAGEAKAAAAGTTTTAATTSKPSHQHKLPKSSNNKNSTSQHQVVSE